MSAEAMLNQRAARSRAIAAACTARLLAELMPLGEDRRVKLAGFSKAKDICLNGIGRAACSPPVPCCIHCGRRTLRPSGHRSECPGYGA